MVTVLPDQPAEFKNRKGGLIFFGILEILMGLFCLLIIAISVLGILLAPYAGPGADQMVKVRVMVPTVVLYGVGAVIFFWLGIGSIAAKRWARSLTLILSAVWLSVGVPAFGFLAYFMPKMMTMMQEQGQKLPEAALIIMQIVMMGIYFVLFVALPGAFFLFYRSPHVLATVEK
ncbi:MAG TPA: hypothetical protein DCS05_04985, partial [Nitrospiraceae bacterium]|nr:hypothetical protein [Nitrospiraceae bacterium]